MRKRAFGRTVVCLVVFALAWRCPGLPFRRKPVNSLPPTDSDDCSGGPGGGSDVMAGPSRRSSPARSSPRSPGRPEHPRWRQRHRHHPGVPDEGRHSRPAGLQSRLGGRLLVAGKGAATVRDLTMIAQLALDEQFIVVKSDSRFKSVKDIVTKPRRRKTPLSIAGADQADRVCARLFENAAGIKMRFVQFNSGGEAITGPARRPCRHDLGQSTGVRFPA